MMMFENRVLRDLRGWKKQKAGENCIMSFMTVLLAKYYQGDKIMEDEMGETWLHTWQRRGQKCIESSGWKS